MWKNAQISLVDFNKSLCIVFRLCLKEILESRSMVTLQLMILLSLLENVQVCMTCSWLSNDLRTIDILLWPVCVLFKHTNYPQKLNFLQLFCMILCIFVMFPFINGCEQFLHLSMVLLVSGCLI